MRFTSLISIGGIIVLCFLAGGCRNKLHRHLRQAELLLQTCPDSAFSLLQHSPLPENAKPADRALYQFLLTAAADKSGQPLAADSLIQQAIQVFEQQGDIQYLPAAYYYKGRIEKNARLQQAPVSLMMAASLAEVKGDSLLLQKAKQELKELNAPFPTVKIRKISSSFFTRRFLWSIVAATALICLCLSGFLYRKYRKEGIYQRKIKSADEANHTLQQRLLHENSLIRKITSWKKDTAKPLSEEEWDELLSATDLIFGQELTRLKTTYPLLTDNDLRLCCLLRLGISSKVIAGIQGVSDASIYKAFYRIKTQKLHLPPIAKAWKHSSGIFKPLLRLLPANVQLLFKLFATSVCFTVL